MNPYRTSAAPITVVRPRRTLVGRIRSWFRARLVKRLGRWRDRNTRCHVCRATIPKRSVLFPGEWVRCEACDAIPATRWSPNTRAMKQGWPGEVCKRCNRRNVVGFSVPEEVWSRVARERWNVLCTTCFDEEAQNQGVSYTLGELHPVTWSEWQIDAAATELFDREYITREPGETDAEFRQRIRSGRS